MHEALHEVTGDVSHGPWQLHNKAFFSPESPWSNDLRDQPMGLGSPFAGIIIGVTRV
jgi:hypothetical protein